VPIPFPGIDRGVDGGLDDFSSLGEKWWVVLSHELDNNTHQRINVVSPDSLR
jgi:hypothetical protein